MKVMTHEPQPAKFEDVNLKQLFDFALNRTQGAGVANQSALRLLADLIRLHRHEIGVTVPYDILTNGYGDFKGVRQNDNLFYNSDEIYEKLKKVVD